MTTKILTVRIPSQQYSQLCISAAEIGIPVSQHVRRLIERESDADQLAQLRVELLAKLAEQKPTTPEAPSPTLTEILLLGRSIAAHLNPKIVTQIRAKLATPRSTQP